MPSVLAAVTLAILAALPVTAQEAVGSIDSIIGDVTIDAYGTGWFIDAHRGDSIYEMTLIRTDYESWADIRVGSRINTIAPLSTTRVSTFLHSRANGTSQGFLRRLFAGVRNFLAPRQEEEELFETRSDDLSRNDDPLWAQEVDPDWAYAQALEALREADFRSAVDYLRMVEYPELAPFDLENYYVNLSYGLMRMGDSEAALRAAFGYHGVWPSVSGAEHLPERLLILSSLSAFTIMEDEIAQAASDAYLARVDLEVASPQVVMVKVYLLRTESRSEEADALLAEAIEANPHQDWAALAGQ
jgi:hypothetical protein